MGATLGAAFAGCASARCCPVLPLSIPAFAMVGMGAMVGGGTGAAMTAVTMIFEMTRDYDIVLPMILAVAVGYRRAAACCRARTSTRSSWWARPSDAEGAACQHVSGAQRPATSWTGRAVARTRHVRFADFLRQTPASRSVFDMWWSRAATIIVGVLRVNTDLRRDGRRGRQRRDAGRTRAAQFHHRRGNDAAAFDVIARMWRRGATMAVVVRRKRRPRAGHVLGVIYQGAHRRRGCEQHPTLSGLMRQWHDLSRRAMR